MSKRRKTESNCLIVLGMHRSGTSALAGTLGLLGAETGLTLIPPHPEINSKGYWENTEIVAIHDMILEALGSSWQDERTLPPMWWQLPELKHFRDELMHIVKSNYTNAALWMMKDPRMCRLMPLWSSILEKVVDDARVILIVRHPHEVAESLKRRDDIPNERAYLLWLRYMLDAEKWSRNYQRVLISYEQLLSDWRSSVDHIAQILQIPISYEEPLMQKKIDDFLEPSLRHHVVAGDLKEGHLLHLAQSVYQACIDTDDLSLLGAALAHFEEEFSAIAEGLKPWSDEVQTLKRSQAKLAAAQAIMSAHEDEIVRIKSTVSWQITKPLRFFANMVCKRK